MSIFTAAAASANPAFPLPCPLLCFLRPPPLHTSPLDSCPASDVVSGACGAGAERGRRRQNAAQAFSMAPRQNRVNRVTPQWSRLTPKVAASSPLFRTRARARPHRRRRVFFSVFCCFIRFCFVVHELRFGRMGALTSDAERRHLDAIAGQGATKRGRRGRGSPTTPHATLDDAPRKRTHQHPASASGTHRARACGHHRRVAACVRHQRKQP